MPPGTKNDRATALPARHRLVEQSAALTATRPAMGGRTSAQATARLPEDGRKGGKTEAKVTTETGTYLTGPGVGAR